MKRLIKIFALLYLIMLMPDTAHAQVKPRIGIEGNIGFGMRYEYDSRGVFQQKMLSDNPQIYSANIVLEHILPRTWTPNWMATSIRWGCGFMQLNAVDYGEFFPTRDYDYDYPYSYLDIHQGYMAYIGLNVPIGVEVKFLLDNNIRIFINGSFINFLSGYDNTDVGNNNYLFGYDYGFGLEYGFYRIGIKNIGFANTFYKGNLGNKMNTLSVSIGFMLNGNRYLKKNSKLTIK